MLNAECFLQIEMIRMDENENQRFEARNKLEELIFETRDSIPTTNNNIMWNSFAEKIRKFLNELEKWLYSHGENCKREAYEKIRQVISDFNKSLQKVQQNNQTLIYNHEFELFSTMIFSIIQHPDSFM